ncbi:hypothetical protein JCGZ_24911 [Jatropha curcas]|uniref:Uncharacterized protein n=1 Tax=Jatropha curcas TaxID=180498 RepID=A0A067KXN6_JATCU|nr:hypothetical protein JCGZ_24911 [Jatropha curcas]
MEIPGITDKSHVVCIPYTAQDHINPMLKLAKLLHTKDGLPLATDVGSSLDPESICKSTSTKCLASFLELLAKLNASSNVPPVTCIVSDGIMTFTLDAAQEIGVPGVLFWNTVLVVSQAMHILRILFKKA